eukprot:gene69316-biopygen17506
MLLSVINNSDPASPVITIDRSTADFIKDMFFSSESAINLLNDLLQYEHIEAGTFRLSCSVVNIVNVLENKFSWANVWASQKDEESGYCVQAREALVAQRNLTVSFDMSRIEQVIRNLITNAMKFTPIDGKVDVNISCELFNSSVHAATNIDRFAKDAVGFLRVEVRDSGVGLSSEEQKKIFGEYSQFDIKELQGGGGSGLGLWISRRIIQMHNGIIGVTSAGHGFGSTFFFELPVFRPDYFSLEPSIHEASTLFGLPLLVLSGWQDDSPLNCKVVARLIESEKAGDFANATLLIADDGATAVHQLRSEMSAGRVIHFILMDYIMTTMHGPDAARIMRDELHFRGAIIGITGNALPDDIEYFISCGANHVITKPLTKAKLMDALHRFLPVAMCTVEE